jgi:hypothetical protein
LLTGYTLGTNTAIAATDNILQSFGKAQGQIDAINATAHAAVTLGTANGLSLIAQSLSLATANSTATGALTGADWTTFNNKLSNTLASARILVGDAGGVATPVAVSGDATLSNTGALTIGNAAVTGKLLTGYAVGANTAITATDNILQSFGKAQGQIDAINATAHAAVTLGTANGLSLIAQSLSLATANGTATGALTGADWTAFNNKLSNTLASARILVGNAGGVATPVAVSGDATLSNTGALTIGVDKVTSANILDGTIVGDDISGTAAIAGSKINPNFGAQNITTTQSLTANSVTVTGFPGNLDVNSLATFNGDITMVGPGTTLSARNIYSNGRFRMGDITAGNFFDDIQYTVRAAGVATDNVLVTEKGIRTAIDAAATVTASGGLTKIGNNITLGGTLPTTNVDFINVAGSAIRIRNTANTANLYTFNQTSFGVSVPNIVMSGALSVTGLATFLDNVVPATDNTRSLGAAGARWTQVFAANGTINTSDRRLKKNIKDISYGLADVMKLRPVSYEWIKGSSGTKLGLIAQELQEVIGEVVHVGDDKEKSLGVYYADLVPVLIKAIQEQQKQIDLLSNKVSTLHTENSVLKAQATDIEQLKTQMQASQKQLTVLMQLMQGQVSQKEEGKVSDK